nr:TetR/AcrR family transcriptional regulator [Novosphingobium sp. CF614]
MRNRAAIIDAAAIEFTSRGKAADIREIAHRAGVAMGTIYRHFPTKEELLDTILFEQFVAWEAAALGRGAAEPNPWNALEEFIADAVCRQAAHVALSERLARPFTERQIDECAKRVAAVADTVVARCHRAGLLREGVTGEDIVQLIICLATLARSPSEGPIEYRLDGGADQDSESRAIERARAPWMRQLRIGMDGLRPVHGTLALPPAE